jgi:hypothetical protein
MCAHSYDHNKPMDDRNPAPSVIIVRENGKCMHWWHVDQDLYLVVTIENDIIKCGFVAKNATTNLPGGTS